MTVHPEAEPKCGRHPGGRPAISDESALLVMAKYIAIRQSRREPVSEREAARAAVRMLSSEGMPVVSNSALAAEARLRRKFRPRRGELRVLIGEPLFAAGDDWQAALQLRDAARRQILAQLGEPDAAA